MDMLSAVWYYLIFSGITHYYFTFLGGERNYGQHRNLDRLFGG